MAAIMVVAVMILVVVMACRLGQGDDIFFFAAVVALYCRQAIFGHLQCIAPGFLRDGTTGSGWNALFRF